MKRICLIGPVDKRPIAYPLIKVLMFLGKTLIVTDDGVYRRFDTDYESNFSYGNSEFLVTPLIDEEVFTEVEKLEPQYDYILFITTNELPPKYDKILYCHGVEKCVASQGVLKVLEDIQATEVFITFAKLGDSQALKIEPSKTVMSYIVDCEEKKEFLATKDQSYATMLHKFFEHELELKKTSIKGLLARGN